MRLTRVVPSIAAATAAALGLAACGSSSSTPSSTTASGGGATPASVNDAPPTSPVTLQEAGSSLLYPLFKIWAPAYHKQVPTVTIAPAAGGSGHGISGALSGTLDIGASDAYLPPAQMAAHKDVMNIPVAISAQMVNYNVPGASKHLKLNGAILQGIYEGKITNWNDPQIAKANPGTKLPNLKIVPLHRSDSSGDTFLFTQYLSKSNPTGWGKTYHYNTTWPGPTTPGSLTENGNGGMVTGCSHTPGCIAYIGISYKHKTDSAGLGEAMLQNKAGTYLLPTASTVKEEAKGYAAKTPPNEAISLIYGPAAGGYPIVNYEYAIVKANQSKKDTAAAIRNFLVWASNPAKGGSSQYLNQVGFQPLPASVVTLSKAQIAKIH